MRRRRAFSAVMVAVLSTAAVAQATGVKTGRYSLQSSPTRAEIGASVEIRSTAPSGSTESVPSVGDSISGPVAVPDTHAYPTLRRGSARLRDATPGGPNSMWYESGDGLSCIYVPAATPQCFNVVGPRSPAGQIRIDPAALAAEAASRLALTPGRIAASPLRPRGGMTGVRSWFWLEPSPTTQQTTASAGPETVTVTAEPTVGWHFGDRPGGARESTRGYRPDRVPAEAVGHTYETRCLPGDRNRNPYVLDTCDARGYAIEAAIVWSISWVAAGPVAGSGTLPSRTTTATTSYPVSEARAFLTTGGAR